MKKTAKKGFTLVELMVVIVIIGILAALAIPRFLGASNKAKATEFKPVLKQIFTLQEAYKQEGDQYGSLATQIGWDNPPGTPRFSYAISNVTTKLGQASPTGGGLQIKYNGTDVLQNTDQACISEAGITTADDHLSQIANVPALACD